MASHKCPHCGAYNSEEGWCIVCRKPIGNLRKATEAAFATSVILGILWVSFTWLTKIQLPFLAMVFGGIVSFCTTHFSAGRGILYQLVATVATIIGIVAADTTAMLIVASDQGIIEFSKLSIPQFLEAMEFYFKYDRFTPFYYIIGVAGGFWIWK